jgi:hypothetical protein
VLLWAGRIVSRSPPGTMCRSGAGITLAAELAISAGCFPQKVVSALRAAFYTASDKCCPCALHSHSSQVVLVGHTEIFTFTSQRRSWHVVMTSRVEFSGYVVYPKSLRVSHKSAGNLGSSRESMIPHQSM